MPPLVVTAIIASIANLRQVTNAARLADQTLLRFAITALVSVSIGIGLGLRTQPGTSTAVDAGAAEGDEPGRTGSWLDFLSGFIPPNVLGLESSGDGVSFNVLQLVVVSIAVASYGWGALAPLATFTIAVHVGLALVLVVLYPVLLRAHGLSIARFFRGAWPAIQPAFVSRSSIGTLPVTERVVTRNLGVPREYASFAVPFGATTTMDGCAATYAALSAIFVAQFFGIDLTIWQYLLIAFVSVVGSAATAGVTGAVVMLTLTLSTRAGADDRVGAPAV